MKRIVLLVFGGLVITTMVHAASFDCMKASTQTEKTICGSAEVSQLDDALTNSYKEILSTSNQPKDIREKQRLWIKSVRNVCTNIECLKKAYSQRIVELKNVSALLRNWQGHYKPISRMCEIAPIKLNETSIYFGDCKYDIVDILYANDKELAIETKETMAGCGQSAPITLLRKDKSGTLREVLIESLTFHSASNIEKDEYESYCAYEDKH
jgi:uncharacterized protein